MVVDIRGNEIKPGQLVSWCSYNRTSAELCLAVVEKTTPKMVWIKRIPDHYSPRPYDQSRLTDPDKVCILEENYNHE